MMAEIPIICAIKAGNDPVFESKCGYTVAPSDPEVTSAILDIHSVGHLEENQWGGIRKNMRTNYSYDTLARKFIEALK